MNDDAMVAVPLPYGVWRRVHAMLMEDPVQRRQEIAAVMAFEQALTAATTHEEPLAAASLESRTGPAFDKPAPTLGIPGLEEAPAPAPALPQEPAP